MAFRRAARFRLGVDEVLPTFSGPLGPRFFTGYFGSDLIKIQQAPCLFAIQHPAQLYVDVATTYYYPAPVAFSRCINFTSLIACSQKSY